MQNIRPIKIAIIIFISAANQVVSGEGPVITSVSPAYGWSYGGTIVHITGTGLGNITGLTFGGNLVTKITRNSDTELVITTPSHVSGNVDIILTTPNGTTNVANGFTYQQSVLDLYYQQYFNGCPDAIIVAESTKAVPLVQNYYVSNPNYPQLHNIQDIYYTNNVNCTVSIIAPCIGSSSGSFSVTITPTNVGHWSVNMHLQHFEGYPYYHGYIDWSVSGDAGLVQSRKITMRTMQNHEWSCIEPLDAIIDAPIGIYQTIRVPANTLSRMTLVQKALN